MKNEVKSWKHRIGRSVHEELKQGFEAWLRGLQRVKQGPEIPKGAEQKIEPPSVQPPGQNADYQRSQKHS